VVIFALTVLGAWVVLSKTRFGRYVYSVGGNADASKLNGINVDAYKIKVFIINAVLAGLAGIVLDTKHFTLRTGGRTFEAAAFLRRAGADTTDVQRLFQSDLSEMVSRYDIIRRAELYREDIAVAAIDQEGVDRVTAAQAADELLSLKGVKASFVVFPSGENVQMSARSLGEVNVQVILEALGGGGNSTTAGGRVENTDVETVKSRLLEAIDAYFEK
jgi:c-di-AMP phosphodiesterase-like protein